MRKLREYRFNCEYCGNEVVKVNRNKNPGRFCNHSCSNKWQHANGIRRAYFADKTNEEWWQKSGLSSEEIAIKKKKRSDRSSKIHRERWASMSDEEKEQFSLACNKGKSLEEMHGKVRAQEIRQAISIANKRPLKERISPESWQAYLDYQRANPPMLDKKHSDETRRAMSKIALKSYRNGRTVDPRSGRGIAGKYKGHLFRSSYEYAFLKKLESQGVVLDDQVEYETIRIGYIDSKGREKTYVPDFLIPSKRIIYEVKPAKRCQETATKQKLLAGQTYCEKNNLEFVVITEVDLDKTLMRLEIIKNDPDVILFTRHSND